MNRRAGVLELIDQIYDCAIEPARWPDTLGCIAEGVDAMMAAISLQSPRSGSVRMLAHWSVDPGFEKLMNERFGINPLSSHAWFVDIAVPFSAVSVLGTESYRKTRFYREVLGPHDTGDGILAVLARSAVRFGSLSLPRGEAAGDYGPHDIEWIGQLTPHIRRSVTISDLLDSRSLHQNALSATLDLLTVGVVLTDAHAHIAHVNRAGQVMFDDNAGLRRDGDMLSAADPRSKNALKMAIETATSGHTVDLPRSGIAVPLPSPSGRDLAAWVLPLDAGLRRELAAPFAAGAAIVVREIGDTSPFPGELFVKRYGITPAECRVLMMLTQGMTPTEAADCLGISLPTTKTHMKRLFEKTGTRGQPDLMRLAMSALAPAVR